MEDFTKDCELITRQISWLHVYCLELNILEQPGMPKERHEEIMALRDKAPHFFWLASNLLKDALILGLDNILDKPKNGRQLTLEHIIENLNDPEIQEKCKKKLNEIQKSPCARDVTRARNHLIAHPNRDTLLKRDEMSISVDFPNLTLSHLEELLRQITNVARSALKKESELDFMFEDWNGASEIFRRLKGLS